MMEGFGKWKKLTQLWKQLDGSYTVMLVPHDGRSISKHDLHTSQMKKAVTCFGAVAQNTEAVQKQLAMLHKIETQVREQMKKSGMELPGKSELTAKKGGKGGPSKKKISNLVVLR